MQQDWFERMQEVWRDMVARQETVLQGMVEGVLNGSVNGVADANSTASGNSNGGVCLLDARWGVGALVVALILL